MWAAVATGASRGYDLVLAARDSAALAKNSARSRPRPGTTTGG